jgi:hypothetical protein
MKITSKRDNSGQRMTVEDIIGHARKSHNKKDAFLDVDGNLYLIFRHLIICPKTGIGYQRTDSFLVHHFCDVEINEL